MTDSFSSKPAEPTKPAKLPACEPGIPAGKRRSKEDLETARNIVCPGDAFKTEGLAEALSGQK